jgi:hypothetical protein
MSPLAGKIIVGLGLTVGMFFVGRLYQNLQNGYALKEMSRKSYPFQFGQLHHIEAFQSIGFGFMTPQSSFLEFEGRTLFKAAPFFQEGIPVFADLKIDANILNWTDGEYDYQLKIQKKKTEPNKAMEPTLVNVTIPASAGFAPFTSAAVMRRVKSSV